MLDQNFWNEYMKVYNLLRKFLTYQKLIDDIVLAVDPHVNEKILEPGCGTGNLLAAVRDRGADVTGIDNSENALKICQEVNPNTNLIFGDISQPLPFINQSFDKLVSNNVLYSIPREKQLSVAKEFFRVLKGGGAAIIINPKKKVNTPRIFFEHLRLSFKKLGIIGGLKNLFSINFKLLLEVKRFNKIIEKEGFFTDAPELEGLLKSAGFSQIEIKPVYCDQAFMAIAKK